MNEGTLVKVYNRDGSVFGRGTLLFLDADLNNLMPDAYSAVWIFNYQTAAKLAPKIFNVKRTLIKPIQTPDDW